MVVVRVCGETVSLLVDPIGNVATVDEETFHASPDTLGDGCELLPADTRAIDCC